MKINYTRGLIELKILFTLIRLILSSASTFLDPILCNQIQKSESQKDQWSSDKIKIVDKLNLWDKNKSIILFKRVHKNLWGE
jgi:hypothetical protein